MLVQMKDRTRESKEHDTMLVWIQNKLVEDGKGGVCNRNYRQCSERGSEKIQCSAVLTYCPRALVSCLRPPSPIQTSVLSNWTINQSATAPVFGIGQSPSQWNQKARPPVDSMLPWPKLLQGKSWRSGHEHPYGPS